MSEENEYVAFYAEANEYGEFKSAVDAKKWLIEYDEQDGIADSTVDGESYIAKITHRSSVKKTHERKDYCVCSYTDPCTCGNEEEWGYNKEYEWVGIVKYDERPSPEIDKAVAEIESNIADLTEFVTDYNQMINGHTAIATLNKIKTILKGE